MSLSIPCPKCETVYPVPEKLIGKTIRCKKCNEMMEVVAPKTTKLPRPEIDDEDDARPVKPRRRQDEDEDEDEDDRPQRRGKAEKSKAPLILGGLAALVLIGGGIAAALFLGGDKKEADNGVALANAVNPPPNTEVAKPVAANTGKKATEPEPVIPKPLPTDGDVKTGTRTPVPVKQEPTPPPNTAGTPPEVKPAPEIPAVGRGGRGSSTSGLSQDDIMEGRLPAPRRDAALAASVFISCESNFGGGTGSGWFGVEQGLVFTNAHVLDMKSPNAQEPKKLTLFLQAGTPQQREIPHAKLKILAVDREMDLAVIQIIGEDKLPTPLKVKPSAELMLGQTVFTVGYPLGYTLSAAAGRSRKEPEVTFRKTSFSGLARNDFGQLRTVKLEGGVTSGNSGGAIIDATGEVVGVVVATTSAAAGSGNTIGFGVPTEYVNGMIAGRVSSVEYGVAYRDKDTVKVPVTAKLLNPLKKSLDIRVRGWLADATAKFREPGPTKPTAETGDSGESELVLKYDAATQTGTGELVFPNAPPGRTYFAQPYYVNSYTTFSLPGLPIPMTGPPVERTPSNLMAVRKEGTKRVATLSNSANSRENYEGEQERKEDKFLIKNTLKINETVTKADASDTAQSSRLRIQFDSMNVSFEALGGAVQQDLFSKQTQAQLNEFIKRTEAYGALNKSGEMYKYHVPQPVLPEPIGTVVKSFAEDALEALVATSIPMPNRTVNSGETWTGTKEVRGVVISGPAKVGTGGALQQPKPREYRYRDQMTYRYLGVRERAGRKEAVVEIEGKSVQAPGSKDTVSGTTKGIAWVEIETGVVLKAKVEKEFEIDTSRDGQKKKLSSLNTYEVDRGSAQ